MHIELWGNKGFVTNVSVAIVGSCIEVMINCAERWPDARRVGSSHHYMAVPDNALQPHDCIAVSYSGNPQHEECHIVLIPENSYEATCLKGLAYTNIEKDQVSMLYVPREFFKSKTLVGRS